MDRRQTQPPRTLQGLACPERKDSEVQKVNLTVSEPASTAALALQADPKPHPRGHLLPTWLLILAGAASAARGPVSIVMSRGV